MSVEELESAWSERWIFRINRTDFVYPSKFSAGWPCIVITVHMAEQTFDWYRRAGWNHVIDPFTPRQFESTFSQPFEAKFTSDVVRIGSLIIFHLSKLCKVKFFIMCGVIFMVRLQGKFGIDPKSDRPNKACCYAIQFSQELRGNEVQNVFIAVAEIRCWHPSDCVWASKQIDWVKCMPTMYFPSKYKLSNFFEFDHSIS